MAYDLEEQEQIDELKAFWNRYGNLILTVAIVVLLGVAGWGAWSRYQQSQAGAASVVYEDLRQAAEAKDIARIKETAGVIFEKYGSTAYGEMAAMIAAKAYADAGDLKAARAPLEWAADKARSTEFRSMARLRLAGLLLDEKSYDEALKWLDPVPDGPFGGLYLDRRGDVLQAQGKTEEARAAYKQALEKLPPNHAARQLIQLKLDGLAEQGK